MRRAARGRSPTCSPPPSWRSSSAWLRRARASSTTTPSTRWLWGDDRPGGLDPGLRACPWPPRPTRSPTPVGALVSPLGAGAEDVLLALVLLGARERSAWGCSGSGRRLYAWPVGLLAAAIVAHAPADPELRHPRLRGPADAGARRVGSGARGAAAPARRAGARACSALAGLCCGPRRGCTPPPTGSWVACAARAGRARAAGRAGRRWRRCCGSLSDLAITGNPLWSLTGERPRWRPSSSARPASAACPGSCPAGSARSCAARS